MPQIELFTPVKPNVWQRVKFPLLWLLLAAVIAAAVFAFKELDLGQYIKPAEIQKLIQPFGQMAPLVFICFFVLSMLVLVIPYSVPAAMSVLLFGLPWGIVWTVIGGTISSLAVWGLGKLLGKRLIANRLDNPRWYNLNQRIEKDGFYYLLMLRALSIVPFHILNFACAFTAIRFRDFLLANLIGLIPSAFVYGFGLKLLLDPATPKPLLAALAGGIALVLVTPMVFRQARASSRRRQRQRMIDAFEHPEG